MRAGGASACDESSNFKKLQRDSAGAYQDRAIFDTRLGMAFRPLAR